MKDRIVIPPSECLTCHYKMDSTMGAFESVLPKKGDLSVCAKCGTITQFDEKLNMVALEAHELEEIRQEDSELSAQLGKVQRAIQSTVKNN